MCNDFERPACYVETERRARKKHRCCECGEAIPPGTVYQYASGVWDGRGASFKTCLPCVAARAFLADDCWLFQGLQEQIGAQVWDGWRPPAGATVPAWLAEMIAGEEAR